MSGDGGERAAPGTVPYADAVAELDSIIAELDLGHVDLDVLADRFQRATELIEELDRRIKVTRAKVDELAPRLDAVLSGEPSPLLPPAPATAAPPAPAPRRRRPLAAVEDDDDDGPPEPPTTSGFVFDDESF